MNSDSPLRIAIVGATSAIAHQTAREFARREHAAFMLIGRNDERLQTIAADLRALGAHRCDTWSADLLAPETAHEFAAKSTAALGGPADMVLIAHGSLTDENRAATEPAYADEQLDINYRSALRFINAVVAAMRERKAGQVAVITSVAGERGRASNAFYAGTKAALISYCSGLRARLAADGVQITELRPGIIATPMTAHLPQGVLTSSAEKAGRICAGAIRRRADYAYVPGFWRWIMIIIRLLPEFIFKKLNF